MLNRYGFSGSPHAQANEGSVMAVNRLMMINFFIGLRYVSINIVFIKMICYDGVTKVFALFLHRMLYFKYYIGLYCVLNPYVVDISYPLVNGVGYSQR
jgi:uncharacterized membrane protein